MGKLRDIHQGWFNLVFGADKEITITAERRAVKCKECPEYCILLLHWCKKCGCAIEAKVLAPGSKCPLNKW